MSHGSRRRVPAPSRILLVESGSRRITEAVIPRIREQFGSVAIDLFTCFLNVPDALAGSFARVYNVNHYPRARRLRLTLS